MENAWRAALERPLVRRLTETSLYVRAEFGYGTVTQVAELLRAVAATCIQENITRALIVAGDDDPAHERTLRNALTTMVLAGVSSHFKLAVVPETPRVAHAYRYFHRDVSAAGVATQLFDTEDAATRWLAEVFWESEPPRHRHGGGDEGLDPG